MRQIPRRLKHHTTTKEVTICPSGCFDRKPTRPNLWDFGAIIGTLWAQLCPPIQGLYGLNFILSFL
jgi:hypothetical protein